MMLTEILSTSFWKTVKQVITGEVRLKWVKDQEDQPQAPISASLLGQPNSNVVPADLADAVSAGTTTSEITVQQPLPLPHSTKPGKQPTLTIYCFGLLRVFFNEQPIDKWGSNKAKSIFKYLIANRAQPVPMEMLMELFWPDTEPQYARKSLHQAIYTMRKSFQADDPDFAIVLYDEGCYYLNPAAAIWIDQETFSSYYKSAQQLEHRGQVDEAVELYQVAVSLYEGEFLAEDRYEEWPLLQRERLKHNYLDLLDHLSEYYFDHDELAMVITLCRKLLDADPCREDTHRRLMRAFLRRGQRHLALRQYHLCVQALQDELGVPPMPATTDLFQQIQTN